MVPLTCGNADQVNGSSLLDQRKRPCMFRRLTQSLLGTDLSNLLPLAAHRGLQGFYAGPDRGAAVRLAERSRCPAFLGLASGPVLASSVGASC